MVNIKTGVHCGKQDLQHRTNEAEVALREVVLLLQRVGCSSGCLMDMHRWVIRCQWCHKSNHGDLGTWHLRYGRDKK